MIVDNYILKEHFGEMVLPSRGSNQKQEYKAAIVIKSVNLDNHLIRRATIKRYHNNPKLKGFYTLVFYLSK